jgi:hypothetical protein
VRNKAIAIKKNDTTVDLHITCLTCREPFTLNVSTNAYICWANGESVQVVFPEIPREERELLVSATCAKCWCDIFGSESGNSDDSA